MSMFSKFGSVIIDLVKAPLDAVSDLIREPSKRWEHQRNETERNSDHERTIRMKELEVELRIKEETGVRKALIDLEEIVKDNDFQRMMMTTDAIKKYQKELTILNTETIKAIGEMHLDLKKKAQDLVHSKTLQYRDLQDEAMNRAMSELLEIENKFGDNVAAQNILIKAVDVKLSNIINAANNFLMELNRDIVILNNDISMLSKQGQKFIEDHLNRIAINGGLNERKEKIINPKELLE
ncbi:hypothetical protein [Rahnella sp. ChDrAdgB13]|uniref:hypothetical protein n=1 Tax=Rahnella sp. ChDrAdgB13 TaxID=1850581 RepID=UPI001AD88534|nr:hypothetical protein [Rahnella sp. ChDrAdgB13]